MNPTTSSDKRTDEERKPHFHFRRHSASSEDCRVFTSEEFLRAPSEAAALAARGTPVCIEAGNVKFVVGSSGRGFQKRRRWLLLRKLRSKIVNSLHPAKRPLDVSWIE